MRPEEFVARYREARASAILRTNVADAVAPAMEAAIRGGFRVIEFTLNTPNAMQHIAEFSARESLIVGAGTVLTPTDAYTAVDAGAQFIVSPVVDEAVIEEAAELGVAVMPGTQTPTEMQRAWEAGAQLQKLFPGPAGGPLYVKACLGPLPHLKIVPTSGVDENNAAAFLHAGAWALGFVAPLFVPEDMVEGRFDRIEERARRFVDAANRPGG
jgi:Entner-Doudoroff aldolase